jgi:hypothetical protein
MKAAADGISTGIGRVLFLDLEVEKVLDFSFASALRIADSNAKRALAPNCFASFSFAFFLMKDSTFLRSSNSRISRLKVVEFRNLMFHSRDLWKRGFHVCL